MTNDKDPFAIRKRNLKVSDDNPFAVADERGNLPDNPKSDLDIADLFKGEMTEEDRASQMREHLVNKAKKDNGHDIPPDLPTTSIPTTVFPTSNTPVPLSDREFKKSLSDTSPNVSEGFSLALVRAEEIEAEIVRKGGRYIPGVDDAKPGVPYTTKQDERVSMLDGQVFKVPLINSLNINSDGITIRGGGIFDPGEGAQVQTPSDFQTNKSANPNDPRSENFLTCSNNQCQYREGCMRFRLKNRRPNSFPFFPESCRKDGIYLSINESDYTGYDNFDTLTRGASNVTRLPNP